MNNPLLRICILLLMVSVSSFAQKAKPITACKQSTFAAFKQLPKLEYDCPEGLIESDDKILELPERLAAIRAVEKELNAFTNAAWWLATVDDLNACKVHGSAGELTGEEKEGWRRGDYSFDLLGNHEFRLALLPDPCYQTGYNGANTFLLYRKNGSVFVTQVLNGYFSRIDNSISVGFANHNGAQLIEVSTANNMPLSLVSYFFVIDPKTNRAIPKKIFKDGGKLTNEIYSAMLMNEPADVGLPKNAEPLNIFTGNRLAILQRVRRRRSRQDRRQRPQTAPDRLSLEWPVLCANTIGSVRLAGTDCLEPKPPKPFSQIEEIEATFRAFGVEFGTPSRSAYHSRRCPPCSKIHTTE